MNLLNNLISEELMGALGWTLLHSLWQGAILAVLIALGMIFLRRASARLRYLIYVSGLIIFLGIVGATFIKEYALQMNSIAIAQAYAHEGSLSESAPLTGLAGTMENRSGDITWLSGPLSYFENNFPLFVTLWLGGMLLFFLRFLGNLAYAQRIKVHRTFEVNEYWKQQTRKLAQSMRMKKPVRILESAIVSAPAVVGSLKPVILIPLGLIAGLPTQQLEAIIAHELAHILRKDYLVNILQSLLEVLFFYHPAIWWLSGNIRIEREHICDDMALKECGNSLEYAKALASIQEMGLQQAGLAPAFAGKKHLLFNRIQRMMNTKRNISNFSEGFIMAMMIIAGIITITSSAAISTGSTNAPYPALEAVSFFPYQYESAATHEFRLDDQATVDVFAPDTLKEVKEAKTVKVVVKVDEDKPKRNESGEEEKIIIMTVKDGQLEEKELLMDTKGHKQVFVTVDDHSSDSIRVITRRYGGDSLVEVDAGVYIDTVIISDGGDKDHFIYRYKISPDSMGYLFKDFHYDLFEDFDKEAFHEEYGEAMEELQIEMEVLQERMGESFDDAMVEYEYQLELLDEKLQDFDIDVDVRALERAHDIYVDILEDDDFEGVKMIDVYHHSPGYHKTNQIIRQELERDGLVRYSGEYVVVIEEKGMLINGEKQAREVHKKYKRLYESLEDDPLEDGNSFKLIF